MSNYRFHMKYNEKFHHLAGISINPLSWYHQCTKIDTRSGDFCSRKKRCLWLRLSRKHHPHCQWESFAGRSNFVFQEFIYCKTIVTTRYVRFIQIFLMSTIFNELNFIILVIYNIQGGSLLEKVLDLVLGINLNKILQIWMYSGNNE